MRHFKTALRVAVAGIALAAVASLAGCRGRSIAFASDGYSYPVYNDSYYYGPDYYAFGFDHHNYRHHDRDGSAWGGSRGFDHDRAWSGRGGSFDRGRAMGGAGSLRGGVGGGIRGGGGGHRR
jgi:hypothetical protein